jgi:hypothetical protein
METLYFDKPNEIITTPTLDESLYEILHITKPTYIF